MTSLRPGSNEVLRYYDVNINAGGPVKKDKAWWHFSWRKQFNSVEQPLFNFDSEFDTWNTNPSAKGTYQINQNHKLIGYYQWNMKIQPTRLPQGTYTYDSIGPTTRQESPSWVWKGEWNGTLSNKLYVEARYGDFGYYDIRRANSDEDYFWRNSTRLVLTGASAESQNDRDRKQLTGAATYFLDTKRGHAHLPPGRRDVSRVAVGRTDAERRRQHRAHLHGRGCGRGVEPGGVRDPDGVVDQRSRRE